MRCILANIFKSELGDCSNGGISERHSEVLIEHPRGYIEVDEENPPENLCKIVTRNFGFGSYTHIEPVAKPAGIGWMFGGTLVYSSDSRFKEATGIDYPLCLHDRQETAEEYELYSR